MEKTQIFKSGRALLQSLSTLIFHMSWERIIIWKVSVPLQEDSYELIIDASSESEQVGRQIGRQTGWPTRTESRNKLVAVYL